MLYFCLDTVFNLSKKVLSDAEIKVVEKGLDYAPVKNKINEPELRDFENFCRQMNLHLPLVEVSLLRLNRLGTHQKDTHVLRFIYVR